MLEFDIQQKLQSITQNIIQKLENTGLSNKVNFKITDDSLSDLQNLCNSLIIFVAHHQQPELIYSRNYSDNQGNNNQKIVLQCLKQFIHIYSQLAKLSKILKQTQQLPQLTKIYHKLYQAISTASNNLYQYQSQDEQFLKQKQDLITENLQICEQIQNDSFSSNHSLNKKDIDEHSINEESVTTIHHLRKENQILNEMLRENDQEFTMQIQRYNNTLYDMQETIREYEMRITHMSDYENAIYELERQLVRCQQQKYRDNMLIQNMSKKIRIYQKQRRGINAFISPRGTHVRPSYVMSPNNKILNTFNKNQFFNLTGVNSRMLNFY